MLSSVIHRPLNWDPLLWPHARPQPGKWFSFDHESQVGYISALDLLYTFWKFQWLGPSLWQKNSWIKPDPAILKTRCFLIVLYRGSPGLFFHPSRGRTTRAGLSLPRWPTMEDVLLELLCMLVFPVLGLWDRQPFICLSPVQGNKSRNF